MVYTSLSQSTSLFRVLTIWVTLGTNESGMSTLVKQIRIAYAPETITAPKLEGLRSELLSNLVIAFLITLEMIRQYEWQYKTNEATV